MISSSLQIISQLIEVYENERYSPLSGWSFKGLLPTDRGHVSLLDNSESFSSLSEASDKLTSPGWRFDEKDPWSITTTSSSHAATDSTPSSSTAAAPSNEGWLYSSDFGSFEHSPGSSEKKMIHFVRRRKLSRTLTFDQNHISNTANYTCDNCDTEEIEKICKCFLDVAVEVSITKHPRYISLSKINAIKSILVASTNVCDSKDSSGPFAGVRTTTSTSDNTVGNAKEGGNSATSNSVYPQISDRLKSCISDVEVSGWAKVSSSISGTNKQSAEYITKRTLEILPFFSLGERVELAKLIIQKFDSNFDFHCNVVNCGENCIYHRICCDNVDNGCNQSFSRKWRFDHDAICQFKCVDCERQCGEKVMRKDMAHHLSFTCELRPCLCPYSDIGCIPVAEALTVRGLQSHLDANMNKHLLLSLDRMREQQDVIVLLNKRVKELEKATDINTKGLAAVSASVATLFVNVEASDKRAAKSTNEQSSIFRDDLAKLESKSSKRISEVSSDLNSLKRTLADVQQSIQQRRVGGA